MTLIGKTEFKGLGVFEVYESSRGGSRSPSTYYVKSGDRFISPFERKVKRWPAINITLLLSWQVKKCYKDHPVWQIIAAHNPLLEEIKWL